MDLFKMLRQILVFFIRVYQKTLSLDHGPFRVLRPHGQCKFYPTCSQYAINVIEKRGAIRGGWLAIKRVGRCHPWAVGGVDLPPA